MEVFRTTSTAGGPDGPSGRKELVDGTGVRPPRSSTVAAGYVASAIVQLGMCALGIVFFFSARSSDRAAVLLIPWCVVGTVYVVVAVVMLTIRAGIPGRVQVDPPHLELGRTARLVSLLSTLGASLIGSGAAILLVGVQSGRQVSPDVTVVGVWAMLLSWVFLHWGFSQLYYQDFYSSDSPTMRFPTTEHPRLTEFAYFSFTVGTSFAASDVDVNSSKTRLWVVWHSVVSFFFNGLIIVFALGTILAPGSPGGGN